MQPANPPDGAAPPDMTFEQKRELSISLGTMPPDKLAGVVELIKSSPSHVGGDDDEVELDIDALDNRALWKLDEYVKDFVEGKKRKRTSAYNLFVKEKMKDLKAQKLEKYEKEPKLVFKDAVAMWTAASEEEKEAYTHKLHAAPGGEQGTKPNNSHDDDKVTRAQQLRQEAEGLKHLLQEKEEEINNDLRAQQARREADPVHNMLLGMEKQIKASVAALPAAQRGTTITCDGWYGAERDSFTQGAWANQMLKYINDPANPLEDREEVLRMTAESLDLPDWGKEDQSKDGPGVTGAAPAAGNGQADAASKEERLAAGLKVLEDRLKANEDSA